MHRLTFGIVQCQVTDNISKTVQDGDIVTVDH